MSRKKIQWALVEVRAGDLKENPNNPKIRDDKGFKRLEKVAAKYGLIFHGVINKDQSIIDGHSRLSMVGADETVRVFAPSRQLDKSEYTELNALFDLARAGVPDTMIIEEVFTEEQLTEWDMEKKEKPKIVTTEITPLKMTHVLLSFPPEKMMHVAPLLQKITDLSFVEYDQSSTPQ